MNRRSFLARIAGAVAGAVVAGVVKVLPIEQEPRWRLPKSRVMALELLALAKTDGFPWSGGSRWEVQYDEHGNFEAKRIPEGPLDLPTIVSYDRCGTCTAAQTEAQMARDSPRSTRSVAACAASASGAGSA